MTEVAGLVWVTEVAGVVLLTTVPEVVISVEVIEVSGVVRVVRSRVVVEEAVLQIVVAIEPRDRTNMPFLDALERTQARPQSIRSKALAEMNISFILRTRDTSHLEMSALNESA